MSDAVVHLLAIAAAALLFLVFGLTYRHRACAGRSAKEHGGGCGSCAAPRKEPDHAPRT